VAHVIADDGSRTAFKSASVANVIDTNLDHYALSGSPRQPLDLNSAPTSALRTLAGVTAAMAAVIEKLRKQGPFKDRDDVQARLCAELGDDKGKKLWHAMVSTAGISIRCE
jgi:DNA uptake protein ComE-like DNA-binding protein